MANGNELRSGVISTPIPTDIPTILPTAGNPEVEPEADARFQIGLSLLKGNRQTYFVIGANRSPSTSGVFALRSSRGNRSPL